MAVDNVVRIKRVWNQQAIPVIHRQEKGKILLLRLPYDKGNEHGSVPTAKEIQHGIEKRSAGKFHTLGLISSWRIL